VATTQELDSDLRRGRVGKSQPDSRDEPQLDWLFCTRLLFDTTCLISPPRALFLGRYTAMRNMQPTRHGMLQYSLWNTETTAESYTLGQSLPAHNLVSPKVGHTSH